MPLVLASFGLGSFTMAAWIEKYRWVFMAMTLVFLGLAWYRTFKDRKQIKSWGFGMLFGTTALSVGLVFYSIVFR